jgi:hypothetical protein
MHVHKLGIGMWFSSSIEKPVAYSLFDGIDRMVYVVTLSSQFLSRETRIRVAEHPRADLGL